MKKLVPDLRKNFLNFFGIFCLSIILFGASCKKERSPTILSKPDTIATGKNTYTRNGYTLIYKDESGNFSTAIRDKMINTFFTIYAEEAKRFNTNTATTVNWIMDPNYSGVAETSGATVTFSSSYFTANPNDIDVVTHESMHIVQAYQNTNAPTWLIEGIADYSRYTYGIYNGVEGWTLMDYSIGQSYTDSYGVTATFLVWLEQHYSANIVDQLNAIARNNQYSESTWVSITGKTVEQLYSEYSKDPGIVPDSSNAIISGSTYKIVSSINNSSVLDVKFSGTTDGTLVDLYNFGDTDSQKWIVTSVGEGYYKLQPLNAPLEVLDVQGSGTADGTPVDILADNGTNAQKWKINGLGSGYYTLTPAAATGSRLDVNAGSTINGTKVQIYSSNSSNPQKFLFIKL